MAVPMASNSQKSCCTSLQFSWPKECNVAVLVPLALCDTNTSANVAPYIDCIDKTNAVLPLMMPLEGHYGDAGANGIT